jgi:hypothetical protein
MSDTPTPSDASSSRNDDAPDASNEASPEEASPEDERSEEAARAPSDRESEERSSAGGNVPPEKAPPKRKREEAGAETDGDSPAAGLKGLQKGQEEERRGLLARSKLLQSMLTSNRPLGVRNMLWAMAAVLAVIAGLLAATGRIGAVTQSIADSFRSTPSEAPQEERSLDEVAGDSEDEPFTFANLAGHPDNTLQPYFSGSLAGQSDDKSRVDLIQQFRQLTDRYIKRFAVDDNFTLRVSTGGEPDTLLEVFTFEEERQKYIEAGRPQGYNWNRINALRRQKTRELVDKWVARGVPEGPMRVKWGMATKTKEARRRDNPFIEYEIRLARFFGKSLLMTEIGTKETFNQDDLVSPVDAKSRYQLMPSLLSAYGIHRYRLSTSAGNSILVAEEQHPLITMEPAFKHATASINAMGHEIPGISAYHTGVNNIYNEIIVKFLKNAQEYVSPSITTADAYIWGVTEGFPIVSRNSSFGDFSRTYVVGAYGALKAMEEATIDTSQTILADRMALASGKRITLDHVLTTLAENGGGDLPWKAPDSLSLYTRFARLNKHFHLPAGPDGSSDSLVVGVPERGNVELSATAQGETVRFFLPPGARRILNKNGHADLIDESSVFQFNHDTYADPGEGMKTKYDHQYDRLIDEIRRFGFTEENKQKLADLAQTFEQLAASEPTHYRKTMADVIAKHQRFWSYPGWSNVSQTVQTVLGRAPAETQQPEPLDDQPIQTPENIETGASTGR